MRNSLAKLEGKKLRFTARYIRLGTTKKRVELPKYIPETFILIKDIRIPPSTSIIANHVWLHCATSDFNKLNLDLKTNDLIRFNAMITRYKKGGEQLKIDYMLTFPTNIINLGNYDKTSKLLTYFGIE